MRLIRFLIKVKISRLRCKRNRLNRRLDRMRDDVLLWYPQGKSFSQLPAMLAFPILQCLSKLRNVNEDLKAWVRLSNGLKTKSERKHHVNDGLPHSS